MNLQKISRICLRFGGLLTLLLLLMWGIPQTYDWLNKEKIVEVEYDANLRFTNDLEFKKALEESNNLNKNFFDFNTEALLQALAKNQANEYIRVFKYWPNRLSIDIKEYQPFALWTNGKQVGYVTEEGHLFFTPQQLEQNHTIAQYLKSRPEAKKSTSLPIAQPQAFNSLNITSNQTLKLPTKTEYFFDPISNKKLPLIPSTKPHPEGKTNSNGEVKLCVVDDEINRLSFERMVERLQAISKERKQLQEEILNARKEGKDLSVDYYKLRTSKEELYQRRVAELEFCIEDDFQKNITPGLSPKLLNNSKAPKLDLSFQNEGPIIISNRFYLKKALEFWRDIKADLKESHLTVKELRVNSSDSWTLLLSNGLVLNLDSHRVQYTLKRFLVAAQKIVIPEDYLISYIDLRYDNGIAVKYITKEEALKNPSLLVTSLIPGKGGKDLQNADSDPIRIFPNYNIDEE